MIAIVDCSKDHIDQIGNIAKEDQFVREFNSLWTRWGNWEKAPPIVAVDGKDVVGFLAYTESRTGYLNVYYVWVAPANRRDYIAEDMLDTVLGSHKSARLKLRCKKDIAGSAYKFWTGVGLEPIGRTEKEFAFDVGISDVCNVDSLSQANYTVTADKRTFNIYKKLGMVFTHPAWEHLNG